MQPTRGLGAVMYVPSSAMQSVCTGNKELIGFLDMYAFSEVSNRRASP